MSNVDHKALRAEAEAATSARETLMKKVETLERDNTELRNTVFELSLRLSDVAAATGLVFSLDDYARDLSVLSDATQETERRPTLSSQEVPRTTTSTKRADLSESLTAKQPGLAHTQALTELDLDLRLDRPKHNERQLLPVGELQGHTGAVYVCRYLQNGDYIASGGFDKILRLWDVKSQGELEQFKGHKQLISAMAVSDEFLVSGSYDKSVRSWDIEKGVCSCTVELGAMIQALALNAHTGSQEPTSTDGRVFIGTTAALLQSADLRTGKIESSWRSEHGMITSLYVYQDGSRVLSADTSGTVQLWDARTGSVVPFYNPQNSETTNNHSHGHGLIPQTHSQSHTSDHSRCNGGAVHVSCLASAPPAANEEEGPFLALACFDNTLRVLETIEGTATQTEHRYSIRGPQLRNWPVGAAWWRGEQHRAPHRSALNSAAKTGGDSKNLMMWTKALVLACGSADSKVYLYDLSTLTRAGSQACQTNNSVVSASTPKTAALNKSDRFTSSPSSVSSAPAPLQVLSGHTDRVYVVDWHPTEPTLVSCSADGTLRLWAPQRESRLTRTKHLGVRPRNRGAPAS